MPATATQPAMEPSHRIPHTSVEVAEAVENGINMIKRVGKRTSDAAEELMDDTSQRIKRHPAETVVMAFAAGFLVGGFISWLARRR